MDIVTIDFETYYDKDYSLSKMTTEEYVRSDLFEVIGVSVKINNHPADWYSGDFPGRFLCAIDYSNKAILCHNTAFDGAILSWHFGINPRLWLDTLSMARPAHAVTVGGSLAKLAAFYKLGEKGTEVVSNIGLRKNQFTPERLAAYGDYCIHDNELTYKLFKKLKVGFPVSEMLVIDRTIRMYTEPRIVLDRVVLQKHLANVKLAKAKALDSVRPAGATDEELMKLLNSNVKFASMLGARGVAVPMKPSAKTGEMAYAMAKTDVAFTALLEHPNPEVQALVAARLGTKSTIEETRTQRLIDVSGRGSLPIMLNYYGAHTGRFSGGDKLNLQNLPARKNNAIRTALCPPKGYTLIACDSSQIEARIVAWLADQHDLLDAFRKGRDVYSEFATGLYGFAVSKDTPKERHVGKSCILGLGYGMGGVKLESTLISGVTGMSVDITSDAAYAAVKMYRIKYHKIATLWRMCDRALNDMVLGNAGHLNNHIMYDGGGFFLPNGMRLTYHGLGRGIGEGAGYSYIPDARSWMKKLTARVTGTEDEATRTPIYGGKVTENIVQALARIVTADQMVAISDRYPALFQVHDENVAMAPDAEVKAASAFITKIMSTPPKWAPDLPVACEVNTAKNFGDC